MRDRPIFLSISLASLIFIYKFSLSVHEFLQVVLYRLVIFLPYVDYEVYILVGHVVHVELLLVGRGSVEHVVLAEDGLGLVYRALARTGDPVAEYVFRPAGERLVPVFCIRCLHAGIEIEYLDIAVSLLELSC